MSVAGHPLIFYDYTTGKTGNYKYINLQEVIF